MTVYIFVVGLIIGGGHVDPRDLSVYGYASQAACEAARLNEAGNQATLVGRTDATGKPLLPGAVSDACVAVTVALPPGTPAGPRKTPRD